MIFVLPSTLPYYEGPSDPGELRRYLNIIIRALNQLIQYSGQGLLNGDVREVSGNTAVTSADGVLWGDASGGAFTITVPDPATILSPGTSKVVMVQKIDDGLNPIAIADAGGTVLFALLQGGQAWALLTITSAGTEVSGVQ